MARFNVQFGAATKTRVLLVEDDANDQTLFCLAAERTGLSLSIQAVGDGQEALAYLEGKPPFEKAVRLEAVELVVLDLNMPGMDGFEFLRWVKSSPRWRHLPVVVLTGMGERVWREQAMALGALAYWEKAFDLAGWVRVLRQSWVMAQVHRGPERPAHRIVPGGHRTARPGGDPRAGPWLTHPAQTPYSE